MKFLNFVFVLELVREVKSNTNTFFLRTQDGRILDCGDSCDFTKTLEKFIKELGTSKDVHE